MARDSVTIVDLTLNAATNSGSGTTINTTNGAVIAAGGDTRGLWLRITNTNGSDRVATIKAGDYPPAINQGQGDISITVPATTGDVLIPLESARVCQSDGTIEVDFAASFAGVIRAYRLPKGAR
jgi:hypothetical protein